METYSVKTQNATVEQSVYVAEFKIENWAK